MAGKTYVADTSVFVRWFLAQTGYVRARAVRDEYLAGSIQLATVECARFELPWVLRRFGLLPGHLSRTQYLAAVRTIDDLGIPVASMDVDDVEACAALSVDNKIQFFDAVFVQHAVASGAGLLTADGGQAQIAKSLGVDVELIGNP